MSKNRIIRTSLIEDKIQATTDGNLSESYRDNASEMSVANGDVVCQ